MVAFNTNNIYSVMQQVIVTEEGEQGWGKIFQCISFGALKCLYYLCCYKIKYKF